MKKEKGRIVLDGDGVLLNYNAAYPAVWKRAFGEEIQSLRPDCYHAANEFGIAFADKAQQACFFSHFGEEDWATMPAMPGALDACLALWAAGYTLICVSSMPSQFQAARLRNFATLGFPIEDLIATGRGTAANPKREALSAIAPVAFVDDLADNFRDLPSGIHRALVYAGEPDSPNTPDTLALANSVHGSLLDFAHYWLSR